MTHRLYAGNQSRVEWLANEVDLYSVLGWPDECVLWPGGVGSDGYGKIRGPWLSRRVHVVAWFLATGTHPVEVLDHVHDRCATARDTTIKGNPCFNVTHLEDVSPSENTRRGNAHRFRADRCKRQHEYTPENTYSYPGGRGRKCRACQLLTRLVREGRT